MRSTFGTTQQRINDEKAEILYRAEERPRLRRLHLIGSFSSRLPYFWKDGRRGYRDGQRGHWGIYRNFHRSRQRSSKPKLRDRAPQRLTERYIIQKPHLEDVTFCVDSIDFVEMFFVAGSIPWIDTTGKWIKCSRENTEVAAAVVAAAEEAAEAAITAARERWQLWLAQSAGKRPRFLSSPTDQGRFTAASATRSIGLQGHPDINRFDYSLINPFYLTASATAEHRNTGQFHAPQIFLAIVVFVRLFKELFLGMFGRLSRERAMRLFGNPIFDGV